MIVYHKIDLSMLRIAHINLNEKLHVRERRASGVTHTYHAWLNLGHKKGRLGLVKKMNQ